jgi:hypothetical protein
MTFHTYYISRSTWIVIELFQDLTLLSDPIIQARIGQLSRVHSFDWRELLSVLNMSIGAISSLSILTFSCTLPGIKILQSPSKDGVSHHTTFGPPSPFWPIKIPWKGTWVFEMQIYVPLIASILILTVVRAREGGRMIPVVTQSIEGWLWMMCLLIWARGGFPHLSDL